MTIDELKELAGTEYDESIGSIYGMGYTQGVLDMLDIFKNTLTSVLGKDSLDVTMISLLVGKLAAKKSEELRKEVLGNV